MNEQELPEPAFRLTWKGSAYYVSKPNIGETDCYTAEQMREFAALAAHPKPAAPATAKAVSDEMMDLADRLGSEADAVDPRAWAHLLAYAPKPEPIGFISPDTLEKLQDPEWRARRNAPATIWMVNNLWTVNNPPSRAIVPIYIALAAAPAPASAAPYATYGKRGECDKPALKGRAAIIEAWNDLPEEVRQHRDLAKLWYVVGQCEDAPAPSTAAQDKRVSVLDVPAYANERIEAERSEAAIGACRSLIEYDTKTDPDGNGIEQAYEKAVALARAAIGEAAQAELRGACKGTGKGVSTAEPGKLLARATDLHEKASMPWTDAEALALREAGIDDAAIDELIGECGYAGLESVLADADELRDFTRSVLVHQPTTGAAVKGVSMAERPKIDANDLERMAKERPDDYFLKGSGVLKLLSAIRTLEAEVRTLAAPSMAEPALPLSELKRILARDWTDGNRGIAYELRLAVEGLDAAPSHPPATPAVAVQAEPVAWAATSEDGRVEALGMNQSRRFDTPLYFAHPKPAAPAKAMPCVEPSHTD